MSYLCDLANSLLVFCVFCCTAGATIDSAAQRPSEDEAISLNNRVCGQRCIQRVLEATGFEVELSRVIEDLKYDAKGLSFLEMQKYLTNKGLYVRSVQVPKGFWVDKQSDIAIAHFSSSVPEDIGHYVVVIPSTKETGRIRVWDGVFGESEWDFGKFEKKFSGALLLVSKSPIEKNISVVFVQRQRIVWFWVCIVACILGLLALNVNKKRW